jgi:hypothetical protein
MFRASTPTQKFTFEFNVNQFVDKILITYKQDKIVLEKTLEDCTIDGNSISYTLTQEETNLFSANSVRIQVRLKSKNGKVLTSKTYLVPVEDVLNAEVL